MREPENLKSLNLSQVQKTNTLLFKTVKNKTLKLRKILDMIESYFKKVGF